MTFGNEQMIVDTSTSWPTQIIYKLANALSSPTAAHDCVIVDKPIVSIVVSNP